MSKAFFSLILVALMLPVAPQAPTGSDRSQAYYHFAKARLLDNQGRLSDAVREYETALTLDQDNSFIYSELAQTYLRHRRIRGAVENAEKAIEFDQDNLDAHRVLTAIYSNIIGNGADRESISGDVLDKGIHEFQEVIRIDPTERQAYLMLARLYQLKGESERAAELYRKYLDVEPGSEDGLTALAKLQVEAGDPEEAVDLLREFLKQHPASGRALEGLGEAYTQLEQYDKAADAYNRAIDLDEGDAGLKRALAQVFFYDNQYERAAHLYEEVLKSDPRDGVSLVRLGHVYRQRMNYKRARELLEQAELQFPNSIEVTFNLALLDRDEGLLENSLERIAEALEESERPDGEYTNAEMQNRQAFLTQMALLNSNLDRFDEAVRIFGKIKAMVGDEDGRVDLYIADTYRTAGKLDQAVQYCEQAIQEFPENLQLQMFYADLLAEVGERDKGVSLLSRLLRGDEDDFDLLSRLVHVYQRDKEFDEAQRILDTAMERFADHHEVYFLQGALHERQGQFDQAEKAFRKSLELDPENPAALNYLGYMFADRAVKLEEALEMITKAVEADPINGAYLDSLGWVYFRLGRLGQAEEYLERALLFAHRDPTVHEHLGDLYYRTRQFDEARRAWSRSLELTTDPEDIKKVKEKLDKLETEVANNE